VKVTVLELVRVVEEQPDIEMARVTAIMAVRARNMA
jgi:hypothetical protein